MKPTIDRTDFGSITIGGTALDHDIIILPNGEVKKRKKKLSRAIYGTSHVISLEEAKYVYQPGIERLIIGSGQDDNVRLSKEAADYFERQGCWVDLEPTPRAIQTWNEARGAIAGLFHVTC
jgi:hypothetical protein